MSFEDQLCALLDKGFNIYRIRAETSQMALNSLILCLIRLVVSSSWGTVPELRTVFHFLPLPLSFLAAICSMRTHIFACCALAVADFSVLSTAQSPPLVTAPAVFERNLTYTNPIVTPPLLPGDEGYVDEDTLNKIRLSKRDAHAVAYMCDGPNWTGKCTNVPLVDYICQVPSPTVPLSFGVPVGWQCKFFWGKGVFGGDCAGGTGSDGKFTFPGTGDIGKMYGNKGQPTSYMCRHCVQNPAW
jgi:hypothetical protein